MILIKTVSFSLLFILFFSCSSLVTCDNIPNHIVINEIYYSNEDKSLWWFEIYNPTYQIINTTNWTIWFSSINGPIYFPKQLKKLLPQECVIMCASKESFLNKWHIPSTIKVFEIPFGERWDGISINSDSVPEKGLRIPPLKEGYSWARYKKGYDTDNFNRDFYEEPFPTPGYKNRIEKQEHIHQIPWLSLGISIIVIAICLFLITIYLSRKRG